MYNEVSWQWTQVQTCNCCVFSRMPHTHSSQVIFYNAFNIHAFWKRPVTYMHEVKCVSVHLWHRVSGQRNLTNTEPKVFTETSESSISFRQPWIGYMRILISRDFPSYSCKFPYDSHSSATLRFRRLEASPRLFTNSHIFDEQIWSRQ